MLRICAKCGYYLIEEDGTLYDEWDNDDACYDENLNYQGNHVAK